LGAEKVNNFYVIFKLLKQIFFFSLPFKFCHLFVQNWTIKLCSAWFQSSIKACDYVMLAKSHLVECQSLSFRHLNKFPSSQLMVTFVIGRTDRMLQSTDVTITGSDKWHSAKWLSSKWRSVVIKPACTLSHHRLCYYGR